MPNVLVVDDSSTARMYYREILESAEFCVDEAVNGLEGLEKVVCQHYDIIIVDVNMPKMDGYTFLSQVRSAPDISDLPAIMISTESGQTDRLKAYRAGANLYICKPVDSSKLAAISRLMIGLAPQQRTCP
jgi:two-component system chemotaxis response regulator CheY